MGAEALIRLAAFLCIFVLVAVAERRWPRRRPVYARRARWAGNLGILVIDTLMLRLVPPLLPVSAAHWVERSGWGVLHLVELPFWAAVLVGVVVLDLAIYLQHVMLHALPILWRVHRVHHADPDFDVTTGVRFHPLEIILSAGYKCAAVALLGPPAGGVLLFEVLLNASSMFNHGNLRIPAGTDAWLRRLIVPPDMHRVHHSAIQEETDSNFGFNLSWWDRMFGTYRAQPAMGHEQMTIGLDRFREPEMLSVPRLLAIPFIRCDACGTESRREHFKP